MVTVYAVVCSFTNRAYVGITAGKLSKRFREHRCMARKGCHHSPKFMREWRAFGDDGFAIVSLEILPDTASLVERRETELKWLKHYDALGLLLNAAVISFSPTLEAIRKGIEASRTATGNRWTTETNEKRRLAQIGKPKNHGAKISATKRTKREQAMR